MMSDVRDARSFIKSKSLKQKFPAKDQRLVKRALERNGPGLEFLPFYLIDDGKMGRKNWEITELKC